MILYTPVPQPLRKGDFMRRGGGFEHMDNTALALALARINKDPRQPKSYKLLSVVMYLGVIALATGLAVWVTH